MHNFVEIISRFQPHLSELPYFRAFLVRGKHMLFTTELRAADVAGRGMHTPFYYIKFLFVIF